jgi:fumarate hydratase class II
VIANVANQALASPLGARWPLHPNDHVNAGQSSNDAFPSAVHLATALALRDALLPALRTLEASLRGVSSKTWATLKPGRTHLQDALPMRMGQVFLGHADEMAQVARRVQSALEQEACELALGGTAVGTGFGAARGFAAAVVHDLRRCVRWMCACAAFALVHPCSARRDAQHHLVRWPAKRRCRCARRARTSRRRRRSTTCCTSRVCSAALQYRSAASPTACAG